MKAIRKIIKNLSICNNQEVLDKFFGVGASWLQIPAFSILDLKRPIFSRLEDKQGSSFGFISDNNKSDCPAGFRSSRLFEKYTSISHPSLQRKKSWNLLKKLCLGNSGLVFLARIFIISNESYITPNNEFMRVRV